VNPRVAGASAAAGGQEDALLRVSRAIEAVQCDLNDRGPRPRGSFLFMGSQRGYRTTWGTRTVCRTAPRKTSGPKRSCVGKRLDSSQVRRRKRSCWRGCASLDTFQKPMDSASLQQVARGKIVWIGEAGFLSTRQMRWALDFAARNNCRLILSATLANTTPYSRWAEDSCYRRPAAHAA
jgi:hypothetical protein